MTTPDWQNRKTVKNISEIYDSSCQKFDIGMKKKHFSGKKNVFQRFYEAGGVLELVTD